MKFVFLFSLFCVLFAATKTITVCKSAFFPKRGKPGTCFVDGIELEHGEEAQQNAVCGSLICRLGLVDFYYCDGLEDGDGDGDFPYCCGDSFRKDTLTYINTCKDYSSILKLLHDYY